MTYKTKEDFIKDYTLGKLALVDYIRSLETKGLDEKNIQIELLKNDIVKYDNSLWRAGVGIQGAEASINFQSFASVTQIRIALGLIDDIDDAPVVLASGN